MFLLDLVRTEVDSIIMIKMKSFYLFVLYLIFFPIQFAQAVDCSTTVNSVLAHENLMPKTERTQHNTIEMDSKKIQARREYYMQRAIYTYKKDPKYGDIFNLGEDVDIFLEDQHHFSVIQEHLNEQKKVRVFENTTSKKTQGFSYAEDKRISTLYFNETCTVSEAMVMYNGARCYLKQSECDTLSPFNESKMRQKCSFFGDYSKQSLSFFKKACELMEVSQTKVSDSQKPKAERKDKAPAVR